jgi:hypothetical protein
VIVNPAVANMRFGQLTIDRNNPTNPHAKTLGDIDGDGFIDAVVASSEGDGMFWYQYPTWDKHVIQASGSWTTDMQVADIDADGGLDVVVPDESGVHWYENPGKRTTDAWNQHLIGVDGKNNHDVEVADVNGDGRLDVVTRPKKGGETFFWKQENPTSWAEITIGTRSGEGTALGDLDGDGDIDFAHNGFWVEQVSPTDWGEHDIDINWPSEVGVRIADIDGDGKNDVILAPSESEGRMSWYKALDPKAGPWTEHTIDSSVSFFHTFQVVDMDGDGDLDLVTAEMHQSEDPDAVSIYFNNGAGLLWSQRVVATGGAHNIRVGDIGNDGDLDIFGANWNEEAPDSAVIEYWENHLNQGPSTLLLLDNWQRHLIDEQTPWQSVLSDAADIDGDGLTDIIAGGWWYKNPGSLVGTWTRNNIGGMLHNMVLVYDFDNDGDVDILGTSGQPEGNSFFWAQNDGSGAFAVLDNISPGDGDFPQGVAGARFKTGDPFGIALSWHGGGKGVQMLTVPSDSSRSRWTWHQVYNDSQDEALSPGDLDSDGDIDLFQGTKWLRNDETGWSQFTANEVSGSPDRNRLADIDGDGDLDAVVGFEGTTTNLIWLEHPGDPTDSWELHTIAEGVGGGYSMDVADMDNDGDIDVILGEHKGQERLIIYENQHNGNAWTPHQVDDGEAAIDHHDGTHPVDIDGDGDLDIISIGWSNDKVWLFENKAIDGRS